jgi:hypothetical protein
MPLSSSVGVHTTHDAVEVHVPTDNHSLHLTFKHTTPEARIKNE